MIETLKIRSITQADKKYSALISVPAPLNFFLLFLGPVLLTSKSPEKINDTILRIVYLPVLIGSTILFVLGEVVMWPFVYVKMFFHKLTMVWVYSKSYRMSRADKFAKFITYFVIGAPVIIATTVCDTYFFVKHLVKTDLQKIKHKIRNDQLNKNSLDLMTTYFKEK